jgi:predicted small secreted protein
MTPVTGHNRKGKTMIARLIKRCSAAAAGLLLVLLLAASGPTLLGCNTWEGFGEDVEHLGEKMQGDDSHQSEHHDD